jgi:RNA polymerase sigma-70 factor (ECF subfamily)
MEFEEIYKNFSPKIYRVCLGFVNDHERAKDLTQETFISVWQNLKSFRNESGIGTWIYRIATNKCLRQIENDKKAVLTELPVELKASEKDDSKETQHQLLQRFIAELNEIDRIIISLFLEDVPQEQIAEIVGLSHANIRVRIHRIKAHLTKKFKEYGQF